MPRILGPNDGLSDELSEFFADGRHSCPHCGVVAKPHSMYAGEANPVTRFAAVMSGEERYSSDQHPRFKLAVVICSGCGNETLFVRKWDREQGTEFGDGRAITEWHRRVFPLGRATKQFSNTPTDHLEPYVQACEILGVSPAASACMSRRCLQGILKERGYPQKNLADQIGAVLNETDGRRILPASAHDAVDAIRQFGNFGAHPIKDTETLQIIEVEPGEADWCIEIVEELFDHYFERPAKLKAKIAKTNAKLASGGKPAIRS